MSVYMYMCVGVVYRQENELIVRLKGCTPGHRIPVGLLLQGREGIVNGKIGGEKKNNQAAEEGERAAHQR